MPLLPLLSYMQAHPNALRQLTFPSRKANMFFGTRKDPVITGLTVSILRSSNTDSPDSPLTYYSVGRHTRQRPSVSHLLHRGQACCTQSLQHGE